MNRFLLLLVLGTLAVSSASAQFDLIAPFAPRDCIASARSAAGGSAANPRLVAIASIGTNFPVDSVRTIDLSMSLRDGRSRLWAYFFITGANDSIVVVPMVRLLFLCQDPRSLLGGGEIEIPIENIVATPLPASYIEGAGLVSRLNSNADFQQFRTAYPDSVPSLVALSTSPVEAFGFPAQTPFWLLTWESGDSPGGGTDTTALPFVCLVHATTGETICGVDIFTSVQEVNDGVVMLAPNPAVDNTVITIPASWVGSVISVDAVSPSGQVVTLMSNVRVASPVLSVSTSDLATGAYMLRVHTDRENVLLPLRVVR